jgi:peptidoglycan/xylan/chitin deacetylase (PgdA/CDA1 family)
MINYLSMPFSGRDAYMCVRKINQSPIRRFTAVSALSRTRVAAASHQFSSNLARYYADWRVGADRNEKFLGRTASSIVFSFDDFGSREQVESVLEILGREQVKAIFFLQGDWAARQPTLVELIRTKGHEIGNHTYSHSNLLTMDDNEVRDEILRGPAGAWLRPPMGRYNARIRNIAHGLGYRIAYWSIDSDDWQGVNAAQMERKIMHELHPGAVILFHLHASETIRLLPELIAKIRDRGYTLASFDENFS